MRVRALLKRREASSAPASGLRLDPGRHGVTVGDRTESLTPTEFRLLAALLARPGTVVGARELVAAAWPDGADGQRRTRSTPTSGACAASCVPSRSEKRSRPRAA